MTLFDGTGINISQRHLLTENKFNEILPKEREKRLKLLLNVPIMINDLHRNHPNDNQYENFDICSLPKPRSLLSNCAIRMTESAILRIIQFTVKTDLKRPFYILHKILNLIDRFFQFSLTTSHRDGNQWQKSAMVHKPGEKNSFKNFYKRWL
jgi:hypothetical protein